MRVLKDKILVRISEQDQESKLKGINLSEGFVHLSSSSQIELEEYVEFGNDYEEMEIEDGTDNKYFLMDENNVKLILDKGPSLVAIERKKKSDISFFKQGE